VAVGVLTWSFLVAFVKTSLTNGYTSQSVLIPFIAGYLIWSERNKIFGNIASSPVVGVAITLGGVFTFYAGSFFPGPHQVLTSAGVKLIGVLLMLVGGFVALYGVAALRATKFPVFLLFFMLPIPSGAADKIIGFLQAESAALSFRLFSLLGIPVYREGFILHLPGVSIEVAKECSGINSSVALFLTVLLLAWQTLRTHSRRAVLLLLTIPLSVIKNAVRIVTLTLLALYVDPSFLTGHLHHDGGIVFFLIALALVYPVWSWLHKSEQRRRPKDRQPEAAPSGTISHSAGL
jgi:exosortase